MREAELPRSSSWPCRSPLVSEARGRRIADAFGEVAALAARPPKYETHVIRAIRLDGGIEEKLQQHILLCVAAAELVHVGKHRPHQFDCVFVLALAMRQHRLADR